MEHCADLPVNAVPGRDIWAELGGRPNSWREMAELYRRHGCTCLAEVVDKVLERVPVRAARRGDVVMVRGSLGVCRGDLVECYGATVPLSEASIAWRAS